MSFFVKGQSIIREPVMTSDHNRASASLFSLLDKVSVVETFSRICSSQLLRKSIISDAARVNYGVRRQNVLLSVSHENEKRAYGRTAAPRAAF